MLVKKITLKNFMSHDSTELEIPESGIVVVTGHNGSGKSSLMEGVFSGIWNKTIRGTKPWRSKSAGAVTVKLAGYTVERKATKSGTTKVKWWRDGEEPTKWESNTHAQKALEKELGDYELVRRTSVFSSSDVSHFTLATDAQRKRLIESLLGLDKFDEALERCRDDLRSVKAKYDDINMRQRAMLQRVQSSQESLDQWKDFCDSFDTPDCGVTDGDLKAIKARYEDMNSKLSSTESHVRDIERKRDRAEMEKVVSAKQLASLQDKKCPTCDQPIDQSKVDELEEGFKKAKEESEKLSRSVTATLESLKTGVDILKEQRDAIREEGRAAQASYTSYKANKDKYEKAKAAVERAEVDLSMAEELKKKLAEEYDAVEKELSIVKICDKVLGLKGVRSYVLSQALESIEDVANSWLPRIAGAGLSLELKPYSEKASGGVSDSISLNVLGAGGGHGYKGASGGERRRIDVALLLALAEISAAATNTVQGTLWMDEVFDALDEEGVEGVVSVISELAENRAVFVITHSPILAKRLDANVRIHVDNGSIQVERNK